MSDRAAIEREFLRAYGATQSFAEYLSYTNRRYIHSHFSRTVCAALDKFVQDVTDGLRPVVVFQAPPQHGKSEMVSRRLPAYLMGRFPEMRIGAASYSDELAKSMAQDVRRTLASDEHKRLFPPSRERDKYALNRAGEFNNPGGSGSYLGVGVGAGLTGRPVDCLVAGTLVDTDCGPIRIEDFDILGASVKVLAYRNEELVYARVKAFSCRSSIGIYRVTTESGRVFEATGGHRVFTGKGFVETDQLSPGDVLLCAVQCRKNRTRIRRGKTAIARDGKLVLLPRLFGTTRSGQVGRVLSEMRVQTVRRDGEVLSTLRKNSQTGKSRTGKVAPERRHVPHVPKRVYRGAPRPWSVRGILRNPLRKPGALSTHVGVRKSKVEKWRSPSSRTAAFGARVPGRTSACLGARSACVRFVQSGGGSIGGSPHRRVANEQRVVQFGNALRPLSQRRAQADGWSHEADRVERIERICEEATTYDIQVEGAENFFANGVLVHNCGIIDDAVKNAKEALSDTSKASVWNWYQTVFKTRLSAYSGEIIMATSWAEDDLAGRIVSEMAGDPRLTVLRFPAINEEGEAGYNPELPLGALVPELHPMEQLLEIKASMSDYWWSAMYQQSPRAAGGNVFKTDGVRYYLPKDLPEKFDKVIASWDCTFKDTDGSDYVVGQVWARRGPNAYLLGQKRDRMSFTRTVEEVGRLREEHPKIRATLIEDKANGPAVIDTLKVSVPGILPIEPDGSKLARAHAMTYLWEAGNIYLPHPDIAPWVKDLVNELLSFPAAAHDDQVDAMTQGVRHLFPVFNRLAISDAALARVSGYNRRN